MRVPTLVAAGTLLALLSPSIVSGQNFDTVQVRATPVAGSVHMLRGAGGNLALAVGPDAAFLVDDQYAPLSAKIQAAVRAITDQPIRFVLNTHWHGDHTGGNENLGAAGALIVAHDNVRVRMSAEQFNEFFNRRTPPSPPGALPVVTFPEAVTFHLNGDEIHAFHVANAHTDGDAIVHFRRANVVHMGDVYFNGTYPFIDVSTGGSIDGLIAAVEQVLGMIDGDTRVIPGHGALSNAAALRAYRDMLVAARAGVRREIAQGKTREQVIAAKPTAAFDEAWGRGFIRPEQFVGLLFADLSRR